MGKSTAAADRLRSALRAREAVQLRIGGATYRQIAEMLQISPAQAQKLVVRSLDETRARTAEEVERLREIECRRMDAVIMRASAHVQNESVADRVRKDRTIILASARRSALLGLDAPLRFETQAPPSTGEQRVDLSKLTSDEVREYQRLMMKLAEAPPPAAQATVELTIVPPVPDDDDEGGGDGGPSLPP